MSGVSTILMFAALMSMQPPDVGFSIVGGAMRSQARSALESRVSIAPTWLHGGGGIAIGGRF